MAVEATHSLTLQLPSRIIERLQATAGRRKQPVEQIVAELLDHSLPPLRHQAEREMDRFVEQLIGSDENILRERVQATLTAHERARLEELLELNRGGGLTQEQEEEIEQLLDRVETVATERAAALSLLQRLRTKTDLLP